VIGAGAVLVLLALVGFLNKSIVGDHPERWGASETYYRVLGRWWQYYAVAGLLLLIVGLVIR
jgi:hypothetical protein